MGRHDGERDDESGDVRLAAWRAVLHGHLALLGVLERELDTEVALPLTWYDVLLNLNEAGGRLRMQELARAIVLSKSGLTRLVDRMVATGFLTREPCEGDRRGLLAVLTPAGKDALRAAAPIHLRGVDEHFGRLVDEHEAKVVQDVFERVLRSLRDGGQCDAIADEDEG